MRANKVHKGNTTDPKGTQALCGAGRGSRSGEQFPVSTEWRDVTCKRCKAFKGKAKKSSTADILDVKWKRK